MSDDHGRRPREEEDERRNGAPRRRPEDCDRHSCDGGHRHVTLLDGLSKKCQVYPDEFCELVCRTVMGEKDANNKNSKDKTRKDVNHVNAKDVTLEINAIMKHPHDEKEDEHMAKMYQEFVAVEAALEGVGGVLDNIRAAMQIAGHSFTDQLEVVGFDGSTVPTITEIVEDEEYGSAISE